ncbi:MAG TPA: hypothetical protein VKG63_01075 [Steroidobacteraceae bacterium]|nr:hypothetical protein [Steroidobacteraceae bacterium]
MSLEAKKVVRAGAAESDVPMQLYEEARRRLLLNEPMLGGLGTGGSAAAALTLGEVQALESVGLSTEKWAGEASRDPLTRSIADYMALLETSLSTAEAARYLKVDVSRIRQRLRERSLFGLEYDGERRLPRFQFERKQVVPGLREVLSALPEALNPLDVAEWFLSPNPDLELEGRDAVLSPREWLLKGESVAAVVRLARGFE